MPSLCSPQSVTLRALFAAAILVWAGIAQDARCAENVLSGGHNAKGQVVVACASAHLAALAPWIEHREGQGFLVNVVGNAGNADQVRRRIHAAFSAQPSTRFIVLVGDAPTANDEQPSELTTATFFRSAKINKSLGGGEDIATDNPYADWDADGIPDAAVGRLPVDSAEELKGLVDKILDYEREPPGRWQRKINFIAGVGGFGMLADAVIESGARKFITEGIPAAFRTNMTYASWQSPYYPGGRNFLQAALDRFNEGSLFCVYIGHGSRTSLDFVREQTPFDERYYPILRKTDLDALACENGSPIALFLACHTGSFDGELDSLAEELLRRKGGPVAAVCGSRVTMPYAMSVLGSELMKQCFVARRATLGELMHHAKRGTILNKRDDETSKLLDNIASLLNVHDDLAGERQEHLSLFNLLGDPLLRIGLPETWDLQMPATARAGAQVEIRGKSTFAADAQFELVVTRDRLTFRPQPRKQLLGGRREGQEFWSTYLRANQQTLSAAKTLVTPGEDFRVTLRIPSDAGEGDYHVRMLAVGEENSAVGSVDLAIE
ncbi:MAG: C25 family cysteine peptidase [Pirellulales bacterium]|nr:C25 family cysteine peptidase [Pirellulales bacterium]